MGLGGLLCNCVLAGFPGWGHLDRRRDLRNLLLGALIGYGVFWATNTPRGRGFVSSTRTAVGQVDAKLTKVLAPSEDKNDETCSYDEKAVGSRTE